jgi:DNA-binding MarR family transcriptional regulator
MQASTVKTSPPDAPLSPADRELGYRLGAVMLRCLSGDGGSVIRTLDESGLSFSQMKVLVTLAGERDEPLTVNGLADLLGLSLASTSRAVEGLVKRDLVLRVEDDRDRRVRRLSPTADGRRLSDRILSARLEGLGRFAASLGEEERDKLDQALELLLERDEIAVIYRQYRKGPDR